MPFASVNGIRLCYEIAGAGDPLLLIQGMGLDRRFFASIAAPLGEHFSTILFDNRGVGDSDAPKGPYSAEQMADDAVALLDHLGVEKASVLGISLGGCIAQMLALRRPEKTGRLILGCTFFSGRLWKVGMPAETVRVLLDTRGKLEDVARRMHEVCLSRRFVLQHPEELERLVRWSVEKPVRFHGLEGQRQAFASFDIEDRTGAVAAPALILHGSEDAVIPVERGRELSKALGGSRLQVIEGAGHLFFIEQPALSAALITDFLQSAAVTGCSADP
jgi:3-oxoadipate enol-lactonase